VEPRVFLIPVKDLLAHEETKQSRVLRVARSIKHLGRVMRPIIVEERSLTIIDGHHRYNALRLLGARYAPVVMARYGAEIAGIKPPVRVIRVKAPSPLDAVSIVEEHIQAMVPRGSARLVLRVNSNAIVLKRDLEQLHRVIGLLEKKTLGMHGEVHRVIALPEPLKPRLVRRAAERGEPYPEKTTIHVTELKKLVSPTKLRKLLG